MEAHGTFVAMTIASARACRICTRISCRAAAKDGLKGFFGRVSLIKARKKLSRCRKKYERPCGAVEIK